jgi:hypothetical protein
MGSFLGVIFGSVEIGLSVAVWLLIQAHLYFLFWFIKECMHSWRLCRLLSPLRRLLCTQSGLKSRSLVDFRGRTYSATWNSIQWFVKHLLFWPYGSAPRSFASSTAIPSERSIDIP